MRTTGHFARHRAIVCRYRPRMEDVPPTVIDLRDAPVTIELEAMGDHDAVLAALTSYYERQGQAARPLWVGDLSDGTAGMFDLAVLGLRRLINVETVDSLIGIDGYQYEPWRAAGYEVWVVVPRDRVDSVRRRLRGHADHVQGWVVDGPKVIFDEVATPA